MRILIDMGHPAHVHLFKNFIWEMEKRGHEIKVTARDKDVTLQLLAAYSIPCEIIGKPLKGKFSLSREWIDRTYKLLKVGKKFNPDVYMGVLNPSTALSGFIHRKFSVTLNDTEHATFAKRITYPFTNIILTPSSYVGNIGKKQIRYDGYHELAYLHPNYYTPNPEVLAELGLSEGEKFFIIRFVSWGASHDVGQYGIRNKIGLVKALEQYGRIFITSEAALPPELQSYQIRIAPEKLHDLLYYATLYVGEGATIASECAILGTHAIYVNSLRLGNIMEEDKKYHLVTDFSHRTCTDNTVLDEARLLLENQNLRKEGRKKSENLVQDKIDVTAFLVWLIENYQYHINQKPDLKKIQQMFGNKI